MRVAWDPVTLAPLHPWECWLNRKAMVQRVFRQFAWQAAKLSRMEGSGWCITSVSEDCTSVSLPTGARSYVPELWIELKKRVMVDLFLEVIDVLQEGKVFGVALEHANV